MKAQLNKLTAILLALVLCAAPFAQADVGWARVERKDDTSYVEKAKSWFSSKVQTIWGKPVPQPIVYTTPTVTQPTAATTTDRAPGSTTTDTQPTSNTEVVSNLPRTSTGVAVYKIESVDSIPRLDIGKEQRIPKSQYMITGSGGDLINSLVTKPLDTPELLTQQQLLALMKMGPRPSKVVNVKVVKFAGKGPVNRSGVERILLSLKPETKITLAPYKPLSPDEYRYLSGRLLYQQGDKCAVAVGLFYELAKSPKYEAEGNYYLAMCSKQLGLVTDFIERARRVVMTQDSFYTNKILPEVNPDLPYEFIEPFGEAVLKAASAKRVLNHANPTVAGNVNYIIANYLAQTSNWKTATTFAAQIPENHDKWPHAQYLLALAEYQTGSKTKALALQEELVRKLDLDKTKAEFQGVVILNLARMYFQEQKFKQSREWFQKIYKDHPLWLQGLQEMGWSQLQSGDFEGAIGNMYSVQAPYFSAVYKPESYVIRTIGYLNICQYGDAYRTLTALEKTYRPWLKKMDFYQKVSPDYLTTVRKFLVQKSASAEIDGLPSQVIREMVRHRDYTALQKSLNRQLEEQNAYAGLDKEVDRALARARWMVNNSRKRADTLRTQIASIKKNPQLEQNRLQWKQELDNELALLNGYFFSVDLFDEAKASLQPYKFEVIAGAEKRLTKMRNRIVTTLSQRMERMRSDLKSILDNNELLRYEAFSGSGENIRFQVAGGEKGKRVPAEVLPQSKSMQWDFAGEYWEDEIGNYRSSLKNNCPDTQTAGL